MEKRTTVTLNRSEIEDAISQYLFEKGYATLNDFNFEYKTSITGNTTVSGVVVLVEK